MATKESQAQRLAQVRALLASQDGAGRRSGGVVATGAAALDAMLPGGGLPCGAITELAGPREGGGGMTLAMFFAARAAGAGGRCVVIVDRAGEFYPPAAGPLGLEMQQLVVVRPSGWAEAVWAFEEALRCEAVGAVVGALGRLDTRAARRLQLAAERGSGVGLVLREAGNREQRVQGSGFRVQEKEADTSIRNPKSAIRNSASFAAVRIAVTPFRIPNSEFRTSTSRHLAVQVLKGCGEEGRAPASAILVELRHEAGVVSVSTVSGHRACGSARARWIA